jgi:hypothetical protein
MFEYKSINKFPKELKIKSVKDLIKSKKRKSSNQTHKQTKKYQ